MLAHERHGEGAPLLLVHGIGHRRQGWYPVLDHLVEHREVILVDLPGHGDSPAFSSDGLAAQVYLNHVFDDFIGELGLGRPHVAGNSLGGLIALEAGFNGHASSVTCLSPAGFWKDDKDFRYINRLFRTMIAIGAVIDPAAPLMAKSALGRAAMFGWLAKYPGRITPDAAVGDLRNMLSARPAVYELLSQAYPLTEEVPEEVKVTIAWAETDHVLRNYQAERAKAIMPNAHHLTLQGCGHVPMTDDPRLVASVLLAGSATPLLSTNPIAQAG